jgi:hypothetical protein
MISVRFLPRLYNEEQLRLREYLETAARGVGGLMWNSKDVDTEAEEATALEAVTRRQPMKIKQTEKSYYAL